MNKSWINEGCLRFERILIVLIGFLTRGLPEWCQYVKSIEPIREKGKKRRQNLKKTVLPVVNYEVEKLGCLLECVRILSGNMYTILRYSTIAPLLRVSINFSKFCTKKPGNGFQI